MAWRIVQQPNGLLARFSDIVDDFTAYNMTRQEAFDECHRYEGMGKVESEEKVQRGIDAGLERWHEALAADAHRRTGSGASGRPNA